jgi:hypothetical protein
MGMPPPVGSDGGRSVVDGGFARILEHETSDANSQRVTTVSDAETTSYKNLHIESGSRHYRIKNEKDEIVFRTTNRRDAETYLDLVEKNDRLQRLLEARGIAPHRIYLLPQDEDKRGRDSIDRELADEVVIIAKGDEERAVVVRHLDDGHEEIVDLEELVPIRGGVYLQSSQTADAVTHIVARIPRDLDPEDEEDVEKVSIAAATDDDGAEQFVDDWTNLEDDQDPDGEYTAVLAETTEDALIFRAETEIEKEE